MTYEELITIISRKLEWPESQTATLLETISGMLNEKLLENVSVSIDDFGTFKTRVRPEFISFNPETKERFLMPPAVEVVFEPAADAAVPALPQIDFLPEESLRNSVNSPFAHFEPTLINEGVQFPDISEIIMEEYIEEEISEEPEETDNNEISEKTDTLPVTEVFEEMEISEEQKAFEEPVQHITDTQYVRDIRYRRPYRKSPKRKKLSAVWIPIMGGVAIALAGFFFQGVANRKR